MDEKALFHRCKNKQLTQIGSSNVIEVKKFSFDPICVSLFKEEFFLLGTNNKEIQFFTKEGQMIKSIEEGVDDWAMSIEVRVTDLALW
jgi:hypothetical protein